MSLEGRQELTKSARIRAVEERDAAALQEAVSYVHGDTRPDIRLMHGERLSSGLRLGVVAEAPGRRIVGSILMDRPSPGATIGSFHTFLVHPDWRKLGLGMALLRRIIDMSQKAGLVAAYGDAVTETATSQALARRCGASEVALLFEPWWKDLSGQRPCRVKMYVFFPFGALPHRLVYPPPAYAAVITSLYNDLAASRELCDTGLEITPARASDIAVWRSPASVLAILCVRAFGADLPDAVDALVQEARRARYRVFYLDLPLSDPSTARWGAALGRLGFGFGGVLPERAPAPIPPFATGGTDEPSGDVLRLQRLEDVPGVHGDLAQCSERGRLLAEHVLAEIEAARRKEHLHRAFLRAAALGDRGSPGSSSS